MYQVVHHALADPTNKTRFTLIFANVAPSDILLKEEFDSLKAKHPDTFNVVYTVDKPEGDWTGPVGYINKDLVQQHIPPASLGDKVKILICGPPGQVNAIAGKKDGAKQGVLGGVLKELGYTEDQVRILERWCPSYVLILFGIGIQVLDNNSHILCSTTSLIYKYTITSEEGIEGLSTLGAVSAASLKSCAPKPIHQHVCSQYPRPLNALGVLR